VQGFSVAALGRCCSGQLPISHLSKQHLSGRRVCIASVFSGLGYRGFQHSASKTPHDNTIAGGTMREVPTIHLSRRSHGRCHRP
jgi:hypothetical protein